MRLENLVLACLVALLFIFVAYTVLRAFDAKGGELRPRPEPNVAFPAGPCGFHVWGMGTGEYQMIEWATDEDSGNVVFPNSCHHIDPRDGLKARCVRYGDRMLLPDLIISRSDWVAGEPGPRPDFCE